MAFVDYSVDGAVAVITINRPPVNALSVAVATEFGAAVDRAADETVRAVVVTGSPHFAAGADITEFRSAFEAGEHAELADTLSLVIRRLELLRKPTVAVVRGFALGGGLELAMGCDFRYLAHDAGVGQPEIKLGLIPGGGGTQRLTRLVGTAKARDIIYSGRIVEPAEALAIGLADRVMPADELEKESMRLARQWAEGATTAIGAAKAAINEGIGLPLDDALAFETEAFADVFTSHDAREGVSAFLEKRAPRFEGR